MKALTDGRVDLDVKLVNMVRLFRAGEPVKMSKRAGDFVTLAEVVNEVGKDVVRFMMLTKRADTPLDFDFMKVVEASKDNPVFYVQYAHARISSLKRKAAEAGVDLDRDGRFVAARRGGARAGQARGAISAGARKRRDGPRAAPDRLLPLRSRGRIPRVVEPRQRRSRAALPH